LYRGKVGEGRMVKFIEYGNEEVIHDGMMDKKTMELEKVVQ
jgi:hypothetical protein